MDFREMAEKWAAAINAAQHYRMFKDSELVNALESLVRAAYSQGVEDAAKTVHGEIEVFEEQSERATPARLKKIQKRWYTLKNIRNRILSLNQNI